MKILYYILLLAFILNFSSCARRVVVQQQRPANVTVIQKLPRQYTVVRVKNRRYYKFNGKHYRKTRRGYVLVRI